MNVTDVTQTLRLPDGRNLSYAQYGDSKGKPVLFCHGHPGSRLQAQYLDKTATRIGARIIAPDRPGWGLSDFHRARTLLDWIQDVLALANHLSIDRFAVMGVSGGGPYAAACAYQLPERVTNAVFVAALGPTTVAGVSKGMSLENHFLFSAARFTPWVLPWIYRSMAGTTKDLDTFTEQIAQSLPQVDVVAVQRENYGALLMADMNEAFRRGVQGAAWDMVLYTRPWKFCLEDIRIPTFLWQGEQDKNTPLAMGHYIAHTIPDCHATFLPEEGHLSLIFNYAKQTLSNAINNS